MKYFAIAAAAGLTGCAPPPSAIHATEDVIPSYLAIELAVTGDGASVLTGHCQAKNTSNQPVYVFDSPRMPYLLDERGTLVVLHGVSPPPEAQNLNAIEIPMTRALPPGDTLAFDVSLLPLRLRNHYTAEPASPARHGSAPIVCRVAHGATPIDAATRPRTSIATLLAWQRIESSATMVVRLP